MAFEVTTAAPTIHAFTSITEHQIQTPGTFFGAKPVLHYQSPAAKLYIPRSQYDATPVLHEIDDISAPAQNGESTGAETEMEDVVIQGVDVWVTSQDVIFFSPSKGKGFTIAYPQIACHAIGPYQSTVAVYLQLNAEDVELENTENDYDAMTLDIHLIPTTEASSEGSGPAQAMFDALSACANLHPGPTSSDEDVPEDYTAPGMGGWITSENMHEFVDEEGNFTGGGALGAGAGTVREREDDEEEEEEKVNGDGVDGDTKWQRTG